MENEETEDDAVLNVLAGLGEPTIIYDESYAISPNELRILRGGFKAHHVNCRCALKETK